MKLAIEGFSQEYAISLVKVVSDGRGSTKEIRIDCTDLVLLRWFVDFFPEMKKMTIDGKEYAWLSHKKICEDLPILAISKRGCMERMQKLVEFEILDYQLVKENGTFSFYGFGKNYANLCRSNNIGYVAQTTQGMSVEQHRVCCSNNTGYDAQATHKDNSIIDSDIIDSDIINISIIDNNKKEDNNKLLSKKKDTQRFIPPTLDEVQDYCDEKGYDIDCEQFIDYYTSNGWMVGRNKMKDWKAGVRTWVRNKNEKAKTNQSNGYNRNSKQDNSNKGYSRKVSQEIKYMGTFVDDEDYDDDEPF